MLHGHNDNNELTILRDGTYLTHMLSQLVNKHGTNCIPAPDIKSCNASTMYTLNTISHILNPMVEYRRASALTTPWKFRAS